MTINGIDTVTLGHGLTEDVVKHEFWGTKLVVDRLKQFEGWEEGQVTFLRVKDSKTGLSLCPDEYRYSESAQDGVQVGSLLTTQA